MNNDTKKKHSSNRLQENVGEMDKYTKRMLKLIEEDGDSLSRKEELIGLVEGSYQKYRSLANHYDRVSGELRKSIPLDLQSHLSEIFGPPPSHAHCHREMSVVGSSNASTTLASDSESNNSSIARSNTNYEQNLHGEVIKLKIAVYEKELRVAKEKIRLSEEEITRLTDELHKYESSELTLQNMEDQLKSAQNEASTWKRKVDSEKREVSKLQARITRYKANLSDREKEIRRLRQDMSDANDSLSAEIQQLQDDIARSMKDRVYLEDNLKELDLRRQCLEEEARRLTATKNVMAAEITQLIASVSEKDNTINELKLTCEILNDKIVACDAEISSKDDQITRMSDCLHQLQARCDELSTNAVNAQKFADELSARVEELKIEVVRSEAAILQAAEEKREVIRQLCFSLEYYWSRYHQLRQH